MVSHGQRYGRAHQELRARWQSVVDAGHGVCVRCGRPIMPGEPWDLGHDDLDSSKYAGPEHRAHNRATNGRAAAPARHSRDW